MRKMRPRAVWFAASDQGLPLPLGSEASVAFALVDLSRQLHNNSAWGPKTRIRDWLDS
jgi:hypothetical protein